MTGWFPFPGNAAQAQSIGSGLLADLRALWWRCLALAGSLTAVLRAVYNFDLFADLSWVKERILVPSGTLTKSKVMRGIAALVSSAIPHPIEGTDAQRLRHPPARLPEEETQ